MVSMIATGRVYINWRQTAEMKPSSLTLESSAGPHLTLQTDWPPFHHTSAWYRGMIMEGGHTSVHERLLAPRYTRRFAWHCGEGEGSQTRVKWTQVLDRDADRLKIQDIVRMVEWDGGFVGWRVSNFSEDTTYTSGYNLRPVQGRRGSCTRRMICMTRETSVEEWGLSVCQLPLSSIFVVGGRNELRLGTCANWPGRTRDYGVSLNLLAAREPTGWR